MRDAYGSEVPASRTAPSSPHNPPFGLPSRASTFGRANSSKFNFAPSVEAVAHHKEILETGKSTTSPRPTGRTWSSPRLDQQVIQQVPHMRAPAVRHAELSVMLAEREMKEAEAAEAAKAAEETERVARAESSKRSRARWIRAASEARRRESARKRNINNRERAAWQAAREGELMDEFWAQAQKSAEAITQDDELDEEMATERGGFVGGTRSSSANRRPDRTWHEELLTFSWLRDVGSALVGREGCVTITCANRPTKYGST